MDHVLGIDIGTSACKATLIDAAGRSVAAASDGYSFTTPQQGWAEQDPESWRRGTVECISRALASAGARAEQIAAVGVTGQMHSSVLLDSHLQLLRPPLLWCDQRPAAEAVAANASCPALRDITLNPLLPAFTLSKLLWSRAHEPDVFARVCHVLLPKDLLRFWLTGSLATDPSDAAGTGLFDARRWCWSSELLGHFDIPAGWLPDVLASHAIAGRVGPEAAVATGLREGTPVVTGGGDQATQAVGLAAIDERILVAQIGTSGVIVAAVSEPVAGAFCHAIPGAWVRLDSLHSAGSSVVWVRDTVASGEAWESMFDEARQIPVGAEGLTFLPFLMGERAGFDASVPAAFVGLRPQHGRAHFLRAVMEGVSFELRRMHDRWAIDGDGPSEVRVVGGGATNPLWLQMLADTFDVPVVRLDRDSSYGAAVLAGMGIGWWQRAPDVAGVSPVTPDPVGVRASADAYARYRRLYGVMGAFTSPQGVEP
jgi:xylulokinase